MQHYVEINGWRKGMKKVSVTRLLAHQGGLGLSAAKHTTDHILDGDVVRVSVPTRAAATALAEALVAAGTDARAFAPGDAPRGRE